MNSLSDKLGFRPETRTIGDEPNMEGFSPDTRTIDVNPNGPNLDHVSGNCTLKTGQPDRGSLDAQCISQLFESAWGIPHTPLEFVKEAVKAGHPRNLGAVLPQVLKEAVEVNATTSPEDMAKERTEWFKRWSERARELNRDEADLKNSMPKHRRHVVCQKRLLLWRDMLRRYHYPDLDVFDLMANGVHLAGQIPPSSVFPAWFEPAQMTVAQLELESRRSRKQVLSSLLGPSPHDDIINQKTLEEQKLGWISEPVQEQDLPYGSIINKRFAILQKDKPRKPRVIDDCSASMLNSAVQKTESPKPQSADVAAGLALALLQSMPASQVVGKCLDLKAAYRQVPIAESSLKFAYVAYHDPERGAPVIRQLYALPFGAACAVYGYLRIAHSLWFLLVKGLRVLVTHFYDDFLTLGREVEKDHLDLTLKNFFSLLGWRLSIDKDKPFSLEFSALGIHVSFTRYLQGEVHFCNTECRIREVVSYLEGLVAKRSSTRKELERIRGRMLFAGGQLFGRLGRTCIKAIGECEKHPQCRVSDEAVQSFSLFMKLLTDGTPRLIKPVSRCPMYVFTDAAYEGSSLQKRCGLGAILVGADGQILSALSIVLSRDQRLLLGEGRSQTIIFEAELLVTILALAVWGRFVASKPLVIYTDNNGTRDALISTAARNEVGQKLIKLYLTIETLTQAYPWIARVPSPSNPADHPSRVLVQEIHLDGVTVPVEQCPQKLHDVLSVLK